MEEQNGNSNCILGFFSAVKKLWNAQETLRFSNIRFGYLQYFFAFPLAMIFAMSQHYILQGHAVMFGLSFTTLGTVAFCVGGTVFLVTANEKNIASLSKAASLLALAGLLPYHFMPDGIATFICAVMLMAGIGGCVSLASYSFGFVLNNTERFLGAVMMLFFNGIIRIITEQLSLPGFFIPVLMSIITFGIIASSYLCKSKDFNIDQSNRGRYGAGVWLVMFLFFSYFITKALGIHIEDFHTPSSDLTKGVSIFGAILLCLIVQMVFKRSIWTMCNIFFLATIGCYAMISLGKTVLADVAYGFKEFGLVIAFYMIGCVTNKFTSFKTHKRLLFLMLPTIIPIYIAADLLAGTPLINPVAIGISSALFVAFMLMTPAFSKHLFSEDLYIANASGEMQSDMNTVETVLAADLFTVFLENISRLTPKEREIVGQYAVGKTIEEVRTEMYLASGTLKNHNSHIYVKLGVKTIEELKLYIELICRSDSRERFFNLLKPR